MGSHLSTFLQAVRTPSGICLLLTVGLLAVCSPMVARTSVVPSSPPEDPRISAGTLAQVGFSAHRLERIRRVLEGYVAEGSLGGAVTLVSRHNTLVHHEAIGWLTPGVRMRRDAIFAIASMTKPITSVAVMILYEEGKLLLDDPVSEYLPELERLRVWDASRPVVDGKPATVELEREPTVRDLLRHTSGLAYSADGPVGEMIGQLLSGPDRPNRDFVAELAGIPLVSQPGDAWHYGTSTNVLGYLVEVVSGQPLDVFLEKRVFRPLGMSDTAFHVSEAKRHRMAGLYRADENGRVLPEIHARDYGSPPLGPSGGGGLFSTAADYTRFLQMILDDGVLEGTRVLSRTTVALMTSDHCKGLAGLRPGQGFGLGFRVRTELGRNGVPGSLGELSWAGSYNTFFWADPHEGIVAILMTQTRPYRHLNLGARFKALVYQSLVD